MSRALELAQRAIGALNGGEADAVALTERSGFARFAGSEVHQPTLVENETVLLRVARGGRVGVAATNRVTDDGLAALAQRAAESAASADPDPSFPGLGPPSSLPDVGGFDAATDALTADGQASAAAAAITAAAGFGVYGFFTSGTTGLAVASTTGIAAAQDVTDATVSVLAAAEGASAWAEATSWAAADLDVRAVAREAVEKAERTRDAKDVEPGHYRAVLEPVAIAELLQEFARDGFSGLGLLEERSALTGRIGERLFDSRISISDDPLDRQGLPKAFDFEGTPKRRVELVEGGVAREVVWDRATAARAGEDRASTGHAPLPGEATAGPQARALALAGGEAESPAELAELVGDGIYVTRLHYLSVVEPRRGVITGMTRDGTFRIRGGRLAEPLVNLRFTVAVPELLADVPGLTRERKLVNQSPFYDERFPFGVLTPALATARFTVTGAGSRPGI